MENKLSPKQYRDRKLTYIVGFGLSLVLTIGAYSLTRIHLNSGHTVPTDQVLLYLLSILAVSQLFVQLVFFLHLNQEEKPRMKILLALFATLVVLVIVIGSIWIMSNLNNHGMTPDQTNTFILKDEAVHH